MSDTIVSAQLCPPSGAIVVVDDGSIINIKKADESSQPKLQEFVAEAVGAQICRFERTLPGYNGFLMEYKTTDGRDRVFSIKEDMTKYSWIGEIEGDESLEIKDIRDD